MITEVSEHSEASASSLVGGIVDDFRDLVKNELLLARRQVAEDLRKTREAGRLWACGFGAIVIGGFAFCLMLASLLHTATSPAGSDPASVPMWACYGIACVVFVIGGSAAVAAAQRKFDSIRLLDNQFERAVKEISNER